MRRSTSFLRSSATSPVPHSPRSQLLPAQACRGLHLLCNIDSRVSYAADERPDTCLGLQVGQDLKFWTRTTGGQQAGVLLVLIGNRPQKNVQHLEEVYACGAHSADADNVLFPQSSIYAVAYVGFKLYMRWS